MEGIAGIVRWAQTKAGEALYEEGRKLWWTAWRQFYL